MEDDCKEKIVDSIEKFFLENDHVTNFDVIKNFLSFPEDFWIYIKPKIRFIDSLGDEKGIIYETLMHFDINECLDDLRVFVPVIINLKTALICIHEFKHAYDLFNLLGKKVLVLDEVFEKDARDKENEFIKKYLLK